MRKLLIVFSLSLSQCLALLPPPAASSAETITGTDTYKYVTPKGLSAVVIAAGAVTLNDLNAATNAVTITPSINATNGLVANLNSGSYYVNPSGVKYATNASASVLVMDMATLYSAASISTAPTLSSLIGVSLYKTNVQWAVRFYTNTSGGNLTMSFPTEWLGNKTDQVITNQSVVSVVVYPGMGTNFIVRHIK